MAGGSQIIIDKNGITLITPGKMEVKAGQHLFKSGAKVETKLPFLPEGTAHNLKYIFTDDEGVPYKILHIQQPIPMVLKLRVLQIMKAILPHFFQVMKKISKFIWS